MDSNSKQSNEVVATTTATSVGDASFTESACATNKASDTGKQTEEPKCQETEVSEETQKSHDRDDLTCNKAGSKARQRASAKSLRTQGRENRANDDLTRIQGIGPATARLLQRSGIKSYRELYEAKPERLQSILKDGGAKFEKVDSSSWSDQTRFAMNGDWIGLTSWTTAQVAASEKASEAAGHSETTVNQNSVVAKEATTVSETSGKVDDLTKIQGIGPATAKLLRKSGITTFRTLHETDTKHLQTILKKGGTKFKLVDPSSWTEQSRFAMNGDWIGLTSWTTAHDASSEKASEAAGHSETKVDQNSAGAKHATAVSETSGKADDLTKIQGIGPATAKLLRKSGITTFRALHETNTGHLQTILKEDGAKPKLFDPSSWIEQSRFAMNGDWIGFSNWTTAHVAASEKVSEAAGLSEPTTSGKSTAAVSAGSNKSDDLTKIHGVGPATAQLLQEFGIISFRTLQETSPKRLKSILKIGGSNFELVDSSSWVEQSRFAVNGDWDGLSKWMSTHVAATNETQVAATNLRATSDKNLVARSTRATSARSGKGDDLTKIHGLGPASKKKLNSKGINSFAQVASMTSQQLATLFAESAKRFQLIDTSTWPAQAQQFASAQIEQESTVINLETEILDEIDSIRDMASSSETSSSAPRKKEKVSTRD